MMEWVKPLNCSPGEISRGGVARGIVHSTWGHFSIHILYSRGTLELENKGYLENR